MTQEEFDTRVAVFVNKHLCRTDRIASFDISKDPYTSDLKTREIFFENIISSLNGYDLSLALFTEKELSYLFELGMLAGRSCGKCTDWFSRTRYVSPISTSFTFVLNSTGTGTGVSTLVMEVTEDAVLTLDGTARFYSDAAATLDESTTWNILAGALRTIYIRCPSGTANMVLSDASKLKGIGGPGTSGYGWISQTNAANITFTPAGLIALENLGTIIGNMTISGALPDSLTKMLVSSNSFIWNYTGPMPDVMTILGLSGSNINWTYAGALPAGLKILSLGDSCYWTYVGSLPAGLTSVQFQCPTNNSVNWTYSGALPANLTYIMFDSSNISWTYNGALPADVTSVRLTRGTLAWTYNGIFPVGITSIYLNSESMDWTGLDIGDTGNITFMFLTNYRQAKMSSADMITLLTQLTNRSGTLPSTVVINDYADYAAPPAGVIAAVNILKATKGIFNVILGA